MNHSSQAESFESRAKTTQRQSAGWQGDFSASDGQRAIGAMIEEMHIPLPVGILEGGKQLEMVVVQRQGTFGQVVFVAGPMVCHFKHFETA